jgi:outer membrane lipopolysaccharide assembly protein LptE/RlpB
MDRAQLLGSYEQQTSVEQNLNQDLADQILRALSVVMRPSVGATSRTVERDIEQNAP